MPRGSASSLADQRRKLEAKLRALKAKEAEEANRRFIVAGRAVLDQADADPAFRDQLQQILIARVSKKRDRQLLGLDGAGKGGSSAAAPVIHKAAPIAGTSAGGAVGGPASSSS